MQFKEDKRFKQFCPKGHDKDIVGRTQIGSCKLCAKEYSRTDKHKKYMDKWRKNCQNHEKIRQSRKRYYQKHIVEIRKKQRQYTIEHRNQTNIRITLKRKTNPQYKLLTYLRSRIIRAIKNNKKVGSAVRDLGCTISFLKEYIESKFYAKMTWENWGSVWQLDHIAPLWKFNLLDKNEFLKACHYTNLQPLIIADHQKKTNNEMIVWHMEKHF